MKRLLLWIILLAPASLWGQVSGSITASSTNCSTASSCVISATLVGSNSASTAVIQITGTWSATLQFESSADGITFVSQQGVPTAGGTSVTSTTGNGTWQSTVAGLAVLRVRCSNYVSGTASILINVTTTVAGTALGNAGGVGTLTATGSPASGNVGYWSGATSLTGTANATLDSSGDISFAGTLTGTAAGGFSLTGTEGTCAAGVASSDILCADLTSHQFWMNNNNGGRVPLAGACGVVGNTVNLWNTCLSPFNSASAYTATLAAGAVETIYDHVPGDHFTNDVFGVRGTNLYITLILDPSATPYTTDLPLIVGDRDHLKCASSGDTPTGSNAQGCVLTPSTTFPAFVPDPTSALTSASDNTGSCTYTGFAFTYTYFNSNGAQAQGGLETTMAPELTGTSDGVHCEVINIPNSGVAPTGVNQWCLYVGGAATPALASGTEEFLSCQTFSGSAGTFSVTGAITGLNAPAPPGVNDTGALTVIQQGVSGAQTGAYTGNATIEDMFLDCANLSGSTWTAFAAIGGFISNGQENTFYRNDRIRDCGGPAAIVFEGRNFTAGDGAVNSGSNFDIQVGDAKAANCSQTSTYFNGGLNCNPGALGGLVKPTIGGSALTGTAASAACWLFDKVRMRPINSLGSCTPNGTAGSGANTSPTVVGVEQLGTTIFAPIPGATVILQGTSIGGVHVEGTTSLIYNTECLASNCNLQNLDGVNGTNGHVVHLDVNSKNAVLVNIQPRSTSKCAILDDLDVQGCGGAYDSDTGFTAGTNQAFYYTGNVAGLQGGTTFTDAVVIPVAGPLPTTWNANTHYVLTSTSANYTAAAAIAITNPGVQIECAAKGVVVQRTGTTDLFDVTGDNFSFHGCTVDGNSQSAAGTGPLFAIGNTTTYTVTGVGCPQATPIVCTLTSVAGLVNGMHVNVTLVGGDTNANGTWAITSVNSPVNTITLVGSAGNAAWTSGGTILIQPQHTRIYDNTFQNVGTTNAVTGTIFISSGNRFEISGNHAIGTTSDVFIFGSAAPVSSQILNGLIAWNQVDHCNPTAANSACIWIKDSQGTLAASEMFLGNRLENNTVYIDGTGSNTNYGFIMQSANVGTVSTPATSRDNWMVKNGCYFITAAPAGCFKEYSFTDSHFVSNLADDANVGIAGAAMISNGDMYHSEVTGNTIREQQSTAGMITTDDSNTTFTGNSVFGVATNGGIGYGMEWIAQSGTLSDDVISNNTVYLTATKASGCYLIQLGNFAFPVTNNTVTGNNCTGDGTANQKGLVLLDKGDSNAHAGALMGGQLIQDNTFDNIMGGSACVLSATDTLKCGAITVATGTSAVAGATFTINGVKIQGNNFIEPAAGNAMNGVVIVTAANTGTGSPTSTINGVKIQSLNFFNNNAGTVLVTEVLGTNGTINNTTVRSTDWQGTTPTTQYTFVGTNVRAQSHVITGSGNLASASPSTLTVSPTGQDAFTSSTTFTCAVNNQTSSTDGLKVTYNAVSPPTFTITGPNTVTDTVQYICTGY